MDKTKAIQDKVVNFIKSKTLVEEICRTKHQFSERELFALACKIAPTVSELTKLLNEMICRFNDETLRQRIKRKIIFEERKIAVFAENTDDCFFDVVIKEFSGYYESREACKTFAEATEFIRQYIVYLNNKYPEAKFEIAKRKFIKQMLAQENIETENTEIGCCEYNLNAELVSVDVGSLHECGTTEAVFCADCKEPCFFNIDVKYPKFLANGDLITYPDSFEGEKYGIIVLSNTEFDFTDMAYIIPLDSEWVYKKDYDNIFYAHEHHEFFLIEKADENKLDEWDRNSYLEFKEYLTE